MRNSWLPPEWNGQRRIAHPVNWARLPEYDVGVAFVQARVDHGHENRWYLYIRKFNEADVKAFPVLASTVITSSPGSTQTITSDGTWNNASNSIEVIGAGARGAIGASTATSGGGGGGGAYTRMLNVSITTPGTTQYFAQVGGTTATNGSAGGDSWWTLTSPGTSYPSLGQTAVGAKGGAALASATSATGSAGGATSSSYPQGGGELARAGGTGGNAAASASAGGGGGGAAGQVAGASGSGTAGGAGNGAASGGGTAGTAGSPGGAGGAGTNIQTGPNAGSGGGGGGGNAGPSTGGAGGNYGGGGGGGGRSNGVGGQGAQGVIVLTWTPIFAGTLVTTEAADTASFPAAKVAWNANLTAQDGTPYELLLHFDGANASTTITDSGGKNYTVTPHGAAQLDTSQLVFSNSALKLAAGGDYCDVTLASAIFGTVDFTVDFRARLTSGSTAQMFYDGGYASGNFKIEYDGTNLKFTSPAGTITGSALAANTNYHIAVTRAAGSTRMFLNGVQQGSTLTDSTFYTSNFGYPQIGTGTAVVAGTLVVTEASDVSALAGSVSGGLDAATTAWAAAVVSAGGTASGTRKTLVDNLIVGLKSDGVWSKLDRLWLFAAENTQSALIDIVAASAATATNSPTFTTDLGYTGNNSSMYINSNLANNWGGGNYSRNSACYFGWNNTAGQDVGGLIGTGASNRPAVIFPAYVDGNCYVNISGDPSSATGGFTFATPNSGATGLYLANRTSSNDATIDINGTQLAITSTSASFALTTDNFTALVAAAGTNWSARQISCMGLGGALSSGDRTAINNRIATYMASVGVITDLWAAAVVAAGGTVSAGRKTLITNLIAGLAADGVWQKLDRLWLFAGENAQSALIDLVKAGASSSAATAVNSPTFTTDRGYTGNGSSSYINSNFNPTVGTNNYVQNSASAFVWSNTSGSNTGNLIGQPTNVITALNEQYIDGNTYWSVTSNASAVEVSTLGLGGAIGLWAVNRSGASAEQLYKNGSSVATGVISSVSLANEALWVLATSTVGYSPKQVCCFGAGSSLNSTEQGNLYTRLRTYMTAVGVP